MVFTMFAGEVVSLSLFALGYISIAVLTFRLRPRQKRMSVLVINFLAVILTIFSFLTLSTVGFFMMPLAVIALVRGIVVFLTIPA